MSIASIDRHSIAGVNSTHDALGLGVLFRQYLPRKVFVHDLVCFISHVDKFCVPGCLYFVVVVQNFLSHILDYIIMQMRKY